MSDLLYHVAGFYAAYDPLADHVFMDVRSFTRDGDMVDAAWLRYKGTGLQTQENLSSRAAEYCIYTPITAEAAEMIRALSGLLMQLNTAGVLPYHYKLEQRGQYDTVDVLGRLKVNMEQAEIRTRPVGINCFDIVVLGCAMAGIDLGKVYDRESFSDLDCGVDNRTRGLIYHMLRTECDVYEKLDDYSVACATAGAARVFAMNAERPGSPVHAFAAVLQSRCAMQVLCGRPTVMRPDTYPLPVILQQAANRADIPIPGILRRTP